MFTVPLYEPQVSINTLSPKQQCFSKCQYIIEPQWTQATLSWEVTQANIENILKVFGAIRFVDAYGTKNPYQNITSLWRRENWKPIMIMGSEINSKVLSNYWQPTKSKNLLGSQYLAVVKALLFWCLLMTVIHTTVPLMLC